MNTKLKTIALATILGLSSLSAGDISNQVPRVQDKLGTAQIDGRITSITQLNENAMEANIVNYRRSVTGEPLRTDLTLRFYNDHKQEAEDLINVGSTVHVSGFFKSKKSNSAVDNRQNHLLSVQDLDLLDSNPTNGNPFITKAGKVQISGEVKTIKYLNQNVAEVLLENIRKSSTGAKIITHVTLRFYGTTSAGFSNEAKLGDLISIKGSLIARKSLEGGLQTRHIVNVNNFTVK